MTPWRAPQRRSPRVTIESSSYVCMYMRACIHGYRDRLESVATWFTELFAAGLGDGAKMIHVFTAAGVGNQFPYKNNTLKNET